MVFILYLKVMKINYSKENKTNFQLQKASKLQRILNGLFVKSSFSLNSQQIFVNVVYVDMSKDLLNAKVIIDIFGTDDIHKKELVKKLNKDFVKQVRNIVSQKFKSKYVPEIIFFIEEENKKKQRVLDLIKIEKEKFNV